MLRLGDHDSDLFIRATWSENFGTQGFSSPQDNEFLDIAGAIVTWRMILTNWAPREIWLPYLIKAENALLAEARRVKGADIDRQGKSLARQLNALWVGSRHLLHEGGCGAGGYVDIVFKTEPEKGRVSNISEFDYELCKLCKLKGVQKDPEKCTAWRVAKEPESVSGVYYIQVRWANHAEGPHRSDLNPWSGKLKDVYWLRFP
jgi:hypothetical protein